MKDNRQLGLPVSFNIHNNAWYTIVVIIPKFKLVPYVQPNGTNIPKGIIIIREYQINTVNGWGVVDCVFKNVLYVCQV